MERAANDSSRCRPPPPQLFLSPQSFVQRHRMQLVHDPRAHLHHADGDARAVAAGPDSLHPGPRSWENDLPSEASTITAHPGRSVFCLRTRFAANLSCVPIHNSNVNSASRRSNQPAWPLASIPRAPRFLPCQCADRTARLLPDASVVVVGFPCFRVDERNLLEARVIVTTYNQHVRLLSPEPWLVGTTKVYSGLGADIVMESLHSLTGLLDSAFREGSDAGPLGSLVFHTRKGSFWFCSAGQFPPSDQLNVLLSQNLPELVAGEKIEVALPPGRTPRGAFPGCGA